MSCVRSRLSFFPCQEKKRRLAICCVPIPAWVEIAIGAFSSVVWLSDFVGSLWDCAFFTGDSDGVTKGTRRTGDARPKSAAGREYAFVQSHRPCHVFRGEYAGAPRPRLRQRVFDSLDSLHLIRGHVRFTRGSRLRFTKRRNNRYPRIAHSRIAVPGYTERPARVQFMAGQVVLHCAAASGSRHCRP